MKHTLAFILFVYIFSSSAFGKDEWKKYEYPKSKFKIEFPQAPEYSIDTNQIDSGARVFYTHNWVVEVNDSTHPNFNYIVSASEFPKDYIHSDSTEEFVDAILTSSQNDFLENPNLELKQSFQFEYNGYLCKEFSWFHTEENYYISMKVYLIQNYMYVISIFKNNDSQHNLLAKKCFDSFEIIDFPKGKFNIAKDIEETTYEVDFQGTPRVEFRTFDSEYGKLNTKINILEKDIEGDTLLFFASEVNYKKEIINKNNIIELHQLYKKSVDNSMNAASGVLVSLNDIQYHYNLGKEYKAYVAGGARIMSGRNFYINNHFYSVAVMSNPLKDYTKLIKSFFDSFKLKKIKQ